jgi:hypothetical protein
MAAITGHMIGKEICEALGLGKGVRTIDIHIGCRELVTATVEFIVHDSQAHEVIKTLKRYELVEREGEPAAEGEDVTSLEESVQRTAGA